MMKDKVAVVTGAANGIGRSTAHLLVKNGVNVVGIDIDTQGLDSAASEFTGLGAYFQPIPADLANHGNLGKIFSAAVQQFGAVDILVNSAGILGGTAEFLDLEVAEWNRIYHLNLTAPMLLMQ